MFCTEGFSVFGGSKRRGFRAESVTDIKELSIFNPQNWSLLTGGFEGILFEHHFMWQTRCKYVIWGWFESQAFLAKLWIVFNWVYHNTVYHQSDDS